MPGVRVIRWDERGWKPLNEIGEVWSEGCHSMLYLGGAGSSHNKVQVLYFIPSSELKGGLKKQIVI